MWPAVAVERGGHGGYHRSGACDAERLGAHALHAETSSALAAGRQRCRGVRDARALDLRTGCDAFRALRVGGDGRAREARPRRAARVGGARRCCRAAHACPGAAAGRPAQPSCRACQLRRQFPGVLVVAAERAAP